MPRYKVVILDAKLAHEKEVERNAMYRAKLERPRNPLQLTTAFNRHRRELSSDRQQRKPGVIHATERTECPTLRCADCGHVMRASRRLTPGESCDACGGHRTNTAPNCRNCGDPAHKAACKAAGHCPDCGTKHGIAPDATVTANGYALLEVTPEEETLERLQSELQALEDEENGIQNEEAEVKKDAETAKRLSLPNVQDLEAKRDDVTSRAAKVKADLLKMREDFRAARLTAEAVHTKQFDTFLASLKK